MIAACNSWKWGFFFMSIAFLILVVVISFVFPYLARHGKL
jgi:uncharacterized protein YpmS